tara:strand:- start:165 stop:380 length:216 start_codon:yes stop_codon:yes gene_type:complete
MIELYFALAIVFAYTIMTDLENLRNSSTKSDLKSRNKTQAKIRKLEKDLKLFLLWPWLLIKKTINEYKSRK